MSQPTPSATLSSCGRVGALRELRDLRRANQVMMARLAEDVRDTIAYCRQAQEEIERAMGRGIAGCKALEIGPGQWFAQYTYFARLCEVTAIDLDRLPIGFDPVGYWRMLRDNGVRRFIKTVGRKALGVDRKFFAEYRRQLGVRALPRRRMVRMDAQRMDFAEGTFDFVYSFNVFEHVPDPRAVLRDCARVVKPGGCVLTDLHLFTCDTGCHDPRIVSGERQGLPYWPHLRPRHNDLWRTAGYLNKISLKEWHALFEEVLPGTRWTYRLDTELGEEARKLKEAGELSEYSMEDLLTHWMVGVWRKPG